MAESYDEIRLEVNNGGWTNVYTDIVAGSINGNRGIMDNGYKDRLAEPGYLNFVLRNEERPAHPAGYYTPGHVNCWSGWRTGLDARLAFVKDSAPYYKWYGTIMPLGINPTPGIHGTRFVSVRCHDYVALMTDHDINLMTLQTSLRINDALPFLLANMSRAPLATKFETGVNLFPTVFDSVNKQKAIGTLYDLVMSEWAFGFVVGDLFGGEKLVVESQNTRPSKTTTQIPITAAEGSRLTDESGNVLTDEDGNVLFADETEDAVLTHALHGSIKTGYGRHQVNRLLGTSYPRKVDTLATTVLFTLQNAIKLTPYETKTGIRCTFRDPAGAAQRVSGKNVVLAATANTQADGGGSNVTASLTLTSVIGTDGFEATAYNGTASNMYIITLTATGRGIYFYDYVQMVVEDTTSQATYKAIISDQVNCKYQDDPSKIQAISAYIIAQNKDPHYSVDSLVIWANRDPQSLMSFLYLEPGGKVPFEETTTGIDDDFFIQGYSFRIDANNDVYWTPVLTSDPGFYSAWILGSSALGETTLLG